MAAPARIASPILTTSCTGSPTALQVMKPCADTSDSWVCLVNAGQYLVCRCQPLLQGVPDFWTI
jgi:hypothetical protein